MAVLNLPKKAKKIRYKNSSKSNNLIHRYVYNTSRWAELRLNYLIQNPLCKNCLKKGLLVSVADIHHIIPISTGGCDIQKIQALGFDYYNLKGLCKDCHKKEHYK